MMKRRMSLPLALLVIATALILAAGSLLIWTRPAEMSDVEHQWRVEGGRRRGDSDRPDSQSNPGLEEILRAKAVGPPPGPTEPSRPKIERGDTAPDHEERE